MSDLTERYVWDVTRRLPEKEREDVRRELTSNIADLLPGEPSEEDIAAVLGELGDPALLAEQYRANPRFLISPAMYDTYIRTIKWIIPLVGVITLAVGLALGLLDASKAGPDAAGLVSGMISSGLSLGISGAFHALVWTTVAFVIVERTDKKSAARPGWTVSDLPDEILGGKSEIPLSEGIAGLVATVIFYSIFIAVCAGGIPVAFALSSQGIHIYSLFADGFLRSCIPVVAAAAAFSAAEAIVKIAYRSWNLPVCCVTVMSELAGLGAALYILTRPGMFSGEFLAFMSENAQRWSFLSLLLPRESGGPGYAIVILCAVIGLAVAGSCVSAVVKTLRARCGA